MLECVFVWERKVFYWQNTNGWWPGALERHTDCVILNRKIETVCDDFETSVKTSVIRWITTSEQEESITQTRQNSPTELNNVKCTFYHFFSFFLSLYLNTYLKSSRESMSTGGLPMFIPSCGEPVESPRWIHVELSEIESKTLVEGQKITQCKCFFNRVWLSVGDSFPLKTREC